MEEIDSGIRIIFGKFGKGKGTLNTMLACLEFKNNSLYDFCLKSPCHSLWQGDFFF